ncbi:unnamed protein product [Dovyalis caffra]|uniref:glyoxylate reductase (NADP(+)) n=1 Tax=Dovyalis caffra TaxID=77055 RepID=A0AAV1SAL9_9ROSI|nr:unnamed protein product [Dovyalis caffra]
MDRHHQENHDQNLLPKVLVLEAPPVFKYHEDKLSQKFHFLKAWDSPLPLDQFLTTQAQSVQAILAHGTCLITSNTIKLLPSLGLIVTTSSGLNQIDLQECRRRGVSVAYAGSLFSEDLADIAVGLLIDVLRKISAGNRYVTQGLWANKGDFPFASKLGEKKIGIVGLGSIGLEVAKRLEPFGCNIMYNSRNKKSSVPYPYYPNVCELATNCDVLVICCELNDQTRHMISKEVLLALGKKGFIINVGRGAIIDEQEMVRCLMQGEIAGAGLDVFENEPDVPRELIALDNVVLSPHRAAHTEETLMSLVELVIGNLEAFFSNKPLLSPVVEINENSEKRRTRSASGMGFMVSRRIMGSETCETKTTPFVEGVFDGEANKARNLRMKLVSTNEYQVYDSSQRICVNFKTSECSCGE